jgi:tryptophan synthase alpha chain
LVDRVSWLRERSALPICIGFGISRPEHVKLLAPVSDGVIVGSAIVRMMENAGTNEAGALANMEELVKSLMSAL